jgi:hypothetical protein
MGRTIKISELKKFDVFYWSEMVLPDEKFVFMGGKKFDSLDNTDRFCFMSWDKDKEVELLGRMEFKPELNEIEKDLVEGLKEFKQEIKKAIEDSKPNDFIPWNMM